MGYGRNGRLVARKLRSFTTHILVHDPFVSDQEVTAAGCRPADLPTLLRGERPDFIVNTDVLES